jgi:hypothetical protein
LYRLKAHSPPELVTADGQETNAILAAIKSGSNEYARALFGA